MHNHISYDMYVISISGRYPGPHPGAPAHARWAPPNPKDE